MKIKKGDQYPTIDIDNIENDLVEIWINNRKQLASIQINKDDAKQIIEELQKQFEL